MVKAHRIEAAASKYLTRMRRYSLADIPYKHCFANVSRPWPILGGASGKDPLLNVLAASRIEGRRQLMTTKP